MPVAQHLERGPTMCALVYALSSVRAKQYCDRMSDLTEDRGAIQFRRHGILCCLFTVDAIGNERCMHLYI